MLRDEIVKLITELGYVQELKQSFCFPDKKSKKIILKELNDLSKKYGSKNVAKEAFNIDKEDSYLTYILTLAGNKDTEKYLNLLAKDLSPQPPKGEAKEADFFINIALSFIILDIKEGFVMIEDLLNGRYISKDEIYVEDIYVSLLEIINKHKRVKKILEDIESGLYSDTSFVISYKEEKIWSEKNN